MSTYDSQYVVQGGPSLDRLLDSLKYLILGGDDRIHVEFTVFDTNEDEKDRHVPLFFTLIGEVCGVSQVDKTGLLIIDLVSPQGVVEMMHYNPKSRNGDMWLAVNY